MKAREFSLVTQPIRWRRLPVRDVRWLPERRVECQPKPAERYRSPITIKGHNAGKKPPNHGRRTRGCVSAVTRKRATSVASVFICRSGQWARRMDPKNCAHCGDSFLPSRPERYAAQRFCSRRCGITAAQVIRRGAVTPWQERFWNFVPDPRPDGCWEWTGQIITGGYGRLMVSKTPYMVVAAHRASWEIHNGPIPNGLKVCHECDNRPCVNPSHLFVGTQAENVADMMAKGRWGGTHGPANNLTQYPFEVVEETRRLVGEGLAYREVGRRLGMSRAHVARIARREIRRTA